MNEFESQLYGALERLEQKGETMKTEKSAETIRRLIEVIDGFHGDQLKDRTEQHISREVEAIQSFLSENVLGEDAGIYARELSVPLPRGKNQ